jgi:hypothetical protein
MIFYYYLKNNIIINILLFYSTNMPPKRVQKVESVDKEVLSPEALSNTVDTSKKSVAVTIKGSTNDSDRLQLAQAINNLSVKSESIIAALSELSKFDKERLQSIDMQLEAKKREYQDQTESLQYDYNKLKVNLENEFADSKIKLQQNLHNHKVETLTKLLNEMGMTMIETVKLQSLRNDLETINDKLENEYEDQLDQERSKAKSDLANTVKTLQLEHKAALAELTSQVNQQVKEISVLNDTIKSLKNEISEQRQLTKEVAQASSKAQISQSFAK